MEMSRTGMGGIGRIVAALVVFATVAVGAEEEQLEETEDFSAWYAGAAAGMFMPGSGVAARRAAAAEFTLGHSFSDCYALEAALFSVPHASCASGGGCTLSGGALRALAHLSAIEEFDLLFGSERFDPFVTIGISSIFATHRVFNDRDRRSGIGPEAGFGFFYHLDDFWSLRADARMGVALDSRSAVAGTVLVGLQCEFGGGEE